MNSQLLTSVSQTTNAPKEDIAQKRFYQRIHEKTFDNHSVKKTGDTAKNIFYDNDNDNDNIFLIFNKEKLNYRKIVQRDYYIKQAVLSNFYNISHKLPTLNNSNSRRRNKTYK